MQSRNARQYPAAQVRFYVDADLLGLAKILVQVRNDVTFPGDQGGVLHKRQRPACPITAPAAKDPVWIPQVAAEGWVIITRDSAIQGHSREVGAVVEHGARMVALAGSAARTKFEQLEVVMANWRRIEQCCEKPGPFIYVATRTSFRPLLEQ
ncbi:hypothetical protein [Pseudonocardia xishanensis]|uniref:PIN-like domain-containing protein n=1 Tax=Pseudonocardia xishanensis TaxID=630995 RepID=UPI0031EBDE8B